MKNKKNYFDEIKNYRVEDKFIEHLIRLLFFTIIIGIESLIKRGKEYIGHIKNFFIRRTMSDMLTKYTRYKESVHSLMNKTMRRRNLHMQIHQAINTHFSDYEKRIVFGLKESKDSFISNSRRILTSVKGYSKKISIRYFQYLPETSATSKISSALICMQLVRKSLKNHDVWKNSVDFTETKKYLNSIAGEYRNYMALKFEKFYTVEFRKKISDSSERMKTVRTNIKKLADTIKRAEKKQIGYRFGNSSN